MAKNTVTLPVDSNIESKEAQVGGNLAHRAYNEMTTGSTKPRNSTASHSSSGKDVLVASNAQGVAKLPVPNESGTVGPAPMEITDPKDFKHAPSREKNLHETSIDKESVLNREREAKRIREKVGEENVDNLFPWNRIGTFSSDGSRSSTDSKLVKAYITENFYNDYYYNTAGVVGTCFFSWLLAHWGFSWWSLWFIIFCTASVYRTEFRRFNRNIRDDLTRITVQETLSDRTERTLWLNSFLSKFWVIYMPVLSQQVKDVVNPNLAGVAPGYGIDALSLDEFTLGTKSPTIDGIKSYTKKGKDTVEMDWTFSFTPNDVSNMTAKEAEEKINPKIALGVTVGKGFVSKSLPVLVEDINVAGKLRITIKFGNSFPNIKTVSISLLEPPLIDFALKPVGGDTLGLDIMSFLPGLKTFVKTQINSNVGPMLYNPNKMDIDVEEIMAAQAKDSIGVVAVTINCADNLKGSDFIGNTVDPYVTLVTEKDATAEAPVRTSVKSDVKSPRWNETKYIIVDSLEQKLSLSCYDFNDVRKDALIGKVEFDMAELYQNPSFENISSKLMSDGKARGVLNYDIHWLPVIDKESSENKESTENSKGANEEDEIEAAEQSSDVGILKATLHKVKYLISESRLAGAISPFAELSIDGKRVKRYRTLRRINEPSWEETVEVLIPSKKNSIVSIKVFDEGMTGKELLCEYSSSLEDILNLAEIGQATLKASPQGEISFSALWKPVAMTGSFAPANSVRQSIGVVKMFLHNAIVKDNLSGVGDIDPYINVRLNHHLIFKTRYYSETREPTFNQRVYVPVTSENQTISLDLIDYQKVGDDRIIGTYNFPVSRLMKKNPKTGKYEASEGEKQKECRLLSKRMELTKNYITATTSFMPIVPVYAPEELETVESIEKKIKEKRQKIDKEQEELKKEMEKHPDDYEIVEVDESDEDEKNLNRKAKMNLNELVEHNAGVLDIQVLRGKLAKSSAYLQVLFDDFACPTIVSLKSKNGNVQPDSGSCFIRDLKNSRVTFRITRKSQPRELDDVFTEECFSVYDLLQKGYEKPTIVDVKGSKLEVKFLYTPLSVKLPESETVLDTGTMELKVISAENIPSHDRNGKSDPFVVVRVDGEKVAKTEVQRKTLSPVWNQKLDVPIPSRSGNKVTVEIHDWDRTGSNDLLCSNVLDTTQFDPKKTKDVVLNLKPQGRVKLGVTFVPKYLFPALDPIEGGLAGMPFKAIGGVANIGVGVAGAGLGAAQNVAGAGIGAAQNVAGAGLGAVSNVAGTGLGGLHKGSKLLKGFGSSKKSKAPESDENSKPTERKSASATLRSSLDYDTSKPNNSYTQVQQGNLPTSPQKNGSASSIAGVAGPIHQRTASYASSFARTLAPNGTYKGKVTVVGAENMGKSVQVRVSLAQGGRIKHLYRTEERKADNDGKVKFEEECTFKASPEANLVFGAVALHRFSKDTELGVAQINLADSQIQQDGQLAMKIGRGHLILKIDYGHEDVPPVPDIPSEYKH